MSAIKKLQENAKSASQVNVVDLGIRHLLAKALRDSGVFSNVAVKLDSRRNSLSVKVNGGYGYRGNDTSKLVKLCKTAGLDVQLRLTSQGFTDSTYRVEKLVTTGSVTQAAQVAQNTPTLSQALISTTKVSVALGGVSLGYVSNEVANRIRAIVTADQLPKTKKLALVDLSTNSRVEVEVPTQVANAIENKVPSYSDQGYTVKSTCGVVSIKQGKNHWAFV